MTMQNICRTAGLALTLIVAVLLANVQATWAALIQPNTPQAADAIAKLRHAAKDDDYRAMGHSAEDRDVGIYYYRKAKDARALADQLEGGQAIDSKDVAHALNNEGADKFSPNY